MSEFDNMIVKNDEFDADLANLDNLSNLSDDLFNEDEHLVHYGEYEDEEAEKLRVLSLDEVSFDRDIRFVKLHDLAIIINLLLLRFKDL